MLISLFHPIDTVVARSHINQIILAFKSCATDATKLRMKQILLILAYDIFALKLIYSTINTTNVIYIMRPLLMNDNKKLKLTFAIADNDIAL